MKPIFLVLYVVIVTLVLTILMPRLTEPSPAMKRFLRLSAIAGVIALLTVIMMIVVR